MFDFAMFENWTNFVAVNDVDFTTMKDITDYYEEGRIYKAELAFDKYFKEKEIDILKDIFTTYNWPIFLQLVLKDFVLQIDDLCVSIGMLIHVVLS